MKKLPTTASTSRINVAWDYSPTKTSPFSILCIINSLSFPVAVGVSISMQVPPGTSFSVHISAVSSSPDVPVKSVSKPYQSEITTQRSDSVLFVTKFPVPTPGLRV